jgi:hypothetical protein
MVSNGSCIYRSHRIAGLHGAADLTGRLSPCGDRRHEALGLHGRPDPSRRRGVFRCCCASRSDEGRRTRCSLNGASDSEPSRGSSSRLAFGRRPVRLPSSPARPFVGVHRRKIGADILRSREPTRLCHDENRFLSVRSSASRQKSVTVTGCHGDKSASAS